jgi:hypothetical protein
MEPIVLQFDLPSVKDQKVTDPRISDITLYEDRLEFRLSMVCDEIDQDLGIWDKGIEQDDEVMFLKRCIDGVASSYHHEDTVWKMVVYISNGKVIPFFFSDEIDCKLATQKMKQWLLE